MLEFSYQYDWARPDSKYDHEMKSPESHPYNFDPHYIFRKEPKNEYGMVSDTYALYTDRLTLEFEKDDVKKALEKFTFYRTTPEKPEDAQDVIDLLYGKGVLEVVAFICTCNQFTGYPVGCFLVRKL